MGNLLLVSGVRMIMNLQGPSKPVILICLMLPPSQKVGGVAMRLGPVLESGVELPNELRVGGVFGGQENAPMRVADGGNHLVEAVESVEDPKLEVMVALKHPVNDLGELLNKIDVKAQVQHVRVIKRNDPAK
ncbi:unnamed protein product [Linum trigynum]|uniref:Uncharacterized protein n=1 Tax=Linum trigynum TaxID=586398 RepID=A0AAV2CF44_9ROSI